MKRITLVLLTFLVALPSFGRDVYSVDNKALWARTQNGTEPVELSSYMSTNSTDTIKLMYKLVSNTMPKGWGASLCDNFGCYTDLPDGEMDMTNQMKGLLKVTVLANSTGEAKIKYAVWAKGSSKIDTVVFHVYSNDFKTSVSKVGASLKVDVYPNPTVNTFGFAQKLKKGATVTLFDLTGKKVKEFTPIDIENNIFDIKGLNSGIYLIRVKPGAKKAAITKKIVKK